VVGYNEVLKAGGSRVSCLVTAYYDLGGGDMKRAELNLLSVKVVEIPPVAPVALPVPPAPPIPPPAPQFLIPLYWPLCVS
jgi:hypothetical protein